MLHDVQEWNLARVKRQLLGVLLAAAFFWGILSSGAYAQDKSSRNCAGHANFVKCHQEVRKTAQVNQADSASARKAKAYKKNKSSYDLYAENAAKRQNILKARYSKALDSNQAIVAGVNKFIKNFRRK